MAKLLRAILLGIGLGGAAIWLVGQPADFTPAGYYRSADRDRVQAFCAARGVAEPDAVQFFSTVSHTQGRITLAVIYDCADTAAPNNRLTYASDLGAAMGLISSPPFDGWQWRLQINPAGVSSITGRDS